MHIHYFNVSLCECGACVQLSIIRAIKNDAIITITPRSSLPRHTVTRRQWTERDRLIDFWLRFFALVGDQINVCVSFLFSCSSLEFLVLHVGGLGVFARGPWSCIALSISKTYSIS